MFGPLMTKWYQFLNRIYFPSPTKALVYRLWLDQCLLTPVAVIFFYGSMSTLEGRPDLAISRIKEAYVPTLILNWGVFIPTQLINFTLVPPHLRMVTVGVVSLFWNTYLSAANAAAQKATVEVEVPEGVKDALEDTAGMVHDSKAVEGEPVVGPGPGLGLVWPGSEEKK